MVAVSGPCWKSSDLACSRGAHVYTVAVGVSGTMYDDLTQRLFLYS